MGKIIPHAVVDHTGSMTSGRNKEFPEYTKDEYPRWPMGNNGHAVSRPVAQYISDYRTELFEYQGEDTSLGIWIDESPLVDEMVWVNSKRFKGSFMDDVGKCEDVEAYSIGHNIDSVTMRKCWKIMDEEPGIEKKLKSLLARLAKTQ